MLENPIENAALERRFALFCDRLSLSECEVRSLTGSKASLARRDVDPVHRETCIRLLLELEPLLVELKGEDEFHLWLRRDGFGQTPLAFLATGPESIRGMIYATKSLLCQRKAFCA